MASERKKTPRCCPYCKQAVYVLSDDGMHPHCREQAITLNHMARDHRETTARPQHLQTMREE